MFPRAVHKVAGPSAVTPADQLKGMVPLAHGLGELDRRRDRFILVEAGAAVRSLVAKLPKFDVEGRARNVRLALAVLRLVRVGDPARRLSGISGAVALPHRG